MGEVRRRWVGQVVDRMAGLDMPDARRRASGDIIIETEVIVVTLRPCKGAEITSIVQKQDGRELLFQTAWGGRRPFSSWDSRSQWMSSYSGGWQLLCPNAGPERTMDGAVWGFHGEAALIPWEVKELTDSAVEFEVSLLTAPLVVSRKVVVRSASIRVEEVITNVSPLTPLKFTWMHHPVFGSPLIDGARLDIDALEVWADTSTPGSVLVRGAIGNWPLCRGQNEPLVDLSKLVGLAERREVFACLAGLRTPKARIINAAIGLAVELRWDPSVFRYMWLWEELGQSRGYPWWGRARAVGLEPSSTPPDTAPKGANRSEGEIVLGPGRSKQAFVELVVEAL